MANLTGKSIGRYHIKKELGKGGMAVVYKAYDTVLDCDVAVKVIRTEKLTRDAKERTLARFKIEARSLAQLTHTNIIKVTDYGEYDSLPYLVMPYLPGGTLKDKLGKPMHFQEAARLLAPIAKALSYAHQKGVIHRDIKPSNILMTETAEPMLSDFGIAKILEMDQTVDLTMPGTGVGTPEYMAPEQGLGEQVDQRTDIYSLGIVFFELITGRKPYEADTPLQVMVKHIHDPVPNPSKIIKRIPHQLDQVVSSAIAKMPADRFKNMVVFSRILHLLGTGNLSDLMEVMINSQSVTDGDSENGSRRPLLLRIWRNLPRYAQWSSVLISVLVGLLLTLYIIYRIIPTFPESTVVSMGATPNQETLGTILSEASYTPNPTHTSTFNLSFTPTPSPSSTQVPSTTHDPYLPPSCEMIGQTWKSPIDGMVLSCIPAGEFLMGSTDQDLNAWADEFPQHKVYLDAYWMDQTEVTNGMFQKFVNETGHITDAEKSGTSWTAFLDDWDEQPGANWQHPLGPGSSIRDLLDHPVVHLSWYDAQAYCQWAHRRIPTEAEWEKAARGTKDWIYPWGNELPSGILLNYADQSSQLSWGNPKTNDGYEHTAPVGSYPAGVSASGIFDLAGNVNEWVSDWYSEDYYAVSPYQNPTGPKSGEEKVFRGGSFRWSHRANRTSSRDEDYQTISSFHIGIRCVISENLEISLYSSVSTPLPMLSPTTPIAGASQYSLIDNMVMDYIPSGPFLRGSSQEDL